MSSVIDSDTKIRVSSTLNREVKSYGKQFLTDKSDETCWNSDQGSPQHITLDFSADGRAVIALAFRLMFQGGFAGKECEILGVSTEGEQNEEQWERLMDFYPEDNNRLQVFECPEEIRSKAWKKLRIVFKNTTDFYGRVTVYRLDIMGEKK